MTALLIDDLPQVSPAATRTRSTTWQHRPHAASAHVRGCSVSSLRATPAIPVAPVATDHVQKLYWTRRGLAVMLSLIIGVVAFMGFTIVSAFLAISNEPLDSTQLQAPAAAVAAVDPGALLGSR